MGVRNVQFKSSKKKSLQRIAHEYMKEYGVDTIDLDDVLDWALETRRWDLPSYDPRRQLKREMARALAVEYYEDPQGREVRRMHAVKIKSPQGLLWEWADIKTAKPEHMRLSLQQRRSGVVSDCRQLMLDAQSYNDNNVHGAQLELPDFDINKDLAEASMPSEYPDEAPEKNGNQRAS